MGYIDNARSRAKRRKSPWNLALIPAVAGPWLLLSWVTAVGFGQLYRAIHPDQVFNAMPQTIGGLLMAVAPLFAWLAPAMMLGNLLVAAIPAARRALDAEARPFSGADRRSANRDLVSVSRYMTPGGLLVALIGAVMG
jgi:hypothetical protein